MTSNPWNAINVNPIALKTPSQPFGINGVNAVIRSVFPNIIFSPKPMKTNRIIILAIVTKLPTLPVSDAPRKLT